MFNFSGWYETEYGAEQFFVKQKSIKDFVSYMQKQDEDFGHTALDRDWET